jgi:hypothetical protein
MNKTDKKYLKIIEEQMKQFRNIMEQWQKEDGRAFTGLTQDKRGTISLATISWSMQQYDGPDLDKKLKPATLSFCYGLSEADKMIEHRFYAGDYTVTLQYKKGEQVAEYKNDCLAYGSEEVE